MSLRTLYFTLFKTLCDSSFSTRPLSDFVLLFSHDSPINCPLLLDWSSGSLPP